MLPSAICLMCFVACYVLGRRAVWIGFLATVVIGYFYGIMRANINSPISHFFYDFGVFGFYLALITRRDSPVERFKMRRVMPWVLALIGWPMLIMLLPLQPILIQLVGLRAQIFFVPFILVGALLDGRDMRRIAIGLGVLSLIEIAFALAEVHFGLTYFYPINDVDELIYKSQDVIIGGIANFRIPATFIQSAAYGGNMATSVPLLLGAMVQERRGSSSRNLLLIALGVSAVGVFLSASRSQATMLFFIVLAATFSRRVKNFPWFGWVGLLVAVAALVSFSPRMQRFITLDNTSYVRKRISGSVNSDFLDLAMEYPLGNGLGGGGTSIPYFLLPELHNPVVLENEYARIMLEEGLPGLALWLSLIFWTLTRPLPYVDDPWYLGKWLARVTLVFCFLTAPTGMGMLTSIPGTALLLVFVGWVATPTITAGRVHAIRDTPIEPLPDPTLKTA